MHILLLFVRVFEVLTLIHCLVEFHNWNRVRVKYCDGSSFTGDVEQVDTVRKLNTSITYVYIYIYICISHSQLIKCEALLLGEQIIF